MASNCFFGEMRPADLGPPGRRSVPVTASVAWTIDDATSFEAEGVVFHSGQSVQWLRDRLGVLGPQDDVDATAAQVADNGGVYVVPAFAGRCAPHWARDARAGIVGLTLETGAAHVVRAGVEAMAYQTRDNIDVLVAAGIPVPELKVDGGAARSNLLCQFQSDLLGIPVVRPVELERTALGVAHVAGMGVGQWEMADIAHRWTVDRVFQPVMPEARREAFPATPPGSSCSGGGTSRPSSSWTGSATPGSPCPATTRSSGQWSCCSTTSASSCSARSSGH